MAVSLRFRGRESDKVDPVCLICLGEVPSGWNFCDLDRDLLPPRLYHKVFAIERCPSVPVAWLAKESCGMLVELAIRTCLVRL